VGGPLVLLDPEFSASLMEGILQGLVPRVGLGIPSLIQVIQEYTGLIFIADDFKRAGFGEKSAIAIMVRAACVYVSCA
jgi:hypothetical protein